MPRIELTTQIAAPIERVFDLARSIDAHQESQAKRRERAVAGRMAGLIELGEHVTWEATHFCIRQRLTSRIALMTRPTHFRDSMISGAFKRFDHDHFLTMDPSGLTLMTDVFDFSSTARSDRSRLVDGLFLEKVYARFAQRKKRHDQAIGRVLDFRRLMETRSDPMSEPTSAPMTSTIDLCSDTANRPTAPTRDAPMRARGGDDLYDEADAINGFNKKWPKHQYFCCTRRSEDQFFCLALSLNG